MPLMGTHRGLAPERAWEVTESPMHCRPPIFYRRELEMGRDREGTAVTGKAKDTGGQPWASPFLSAPQFPHYKPVEPENMTATQA